jgi:hypothetical protein
LTSEHLSENAFDFEAGVVVLRREHS